MKNWIILPKSTLENIEFKQKNNQNFRKLSKINHIFDNITKKIKNIPKYQILVQEINEELKKAINFCFK